MTSNPNKFESFQAKAKSALQTLILMIFNSCHLVISLAPNDIRTSKLEQQKNICTCGSLLTCAPKLDRV